jgi:hypothetical protein
MGKIMESIQKPVTSQRLAERTGGANLKSISGDGEAAV